MAASNKIFGIKLQWLIIIIIILILNAFGMYYFSNPLSLDEIAEKEAAYLLSEGEKTKGGVGKKLFDTGINIDTENLTDFCYQEVKKKFGRKYKIAKMEARDVMDQANRRGFEVDIYIEGKTDEPKGYVDCVLDVRFGDPRLLRMSPDIAGDSSDPFS
mgnify:CR=1 FL=1|tara:strand:+ start:113 stop:586 length:474 start_codon:yes stop_codon:yes gene_type:complete